MRVPGGLSRGRFSNSRAESGSGLDAFHSLVVAVCLHVRYRSRYSVSRTVHAFEQLHAIGQCLLSGAFVRSELDSQESKELQDSCAMEESDRGVDKTSSPSLLTRPFCC